MEGKGGHISRAYKKPAIPPRPRRPKTNLVRPQPRPKVSPSFSTSGGGGNAAERLKPQLLPRTSAINLSSSANSGDSGSSGRLFGKSRDADMLGPLVFSGSSSLPRSKLKKRSSSRQSRSSSWESRSSLFTRTEACLDDFRTLTRKQTEMTQILERGTCDRCRQRVLRLMYRILTLT